LLRVSPRKSQRDQTTQRPANEYRRTGNSLRDMLDIVIQCVRVDVGTFTIAR
jgi:hypothetical protein